MTTRAAALLVSLAVLGGCQGRDLLAPEDLPSGFEDPALNLTGWERIERDGFSFALPPGFERESGIPIDSDAATYAHALRGDVLHHDYGPYTGPWEAHRHPFDVDAEVVRVELAGRTAQLVSYRQDDRYVVQAWWEGVAPFPGVGEIHLLLRGSAATGEGREALLAVIHSVRFD